MLHVPRFRKLTAFTLVAITALDLDWRLAESVDGNERLFGLDDVADTFSADVGV